MKFRLLPGVVALSALLLASSAVAQQDSKDTKDEQAPSIQQTAPDQKPDTPADQESPSGKPTLKRTPADSSPQTTSDPTAKPTPDSDSQDDSKKDDSAKKDDTAQKDKPKIVEQPDDSKVKHDGSKNDVNAIGNRKVGGRGLGDWYSLEGEIRMGKQYAQEIEATSKLIRDPVITEYVNRIGQNLVRNSDAQVPFTIKVIDSDEVNAFALPGGFFYVNSGLILAADEESELAGVMAHEIAHVAARHTTRQLTRAQWMNLGTIPLIFVGGGIGYAAYEAAGIALPLTMLNFSRNFESEADYL